MVILSRSISSKLYCIMEDLNSCESKVLFSSIKILHSGFGSTSGFMSAPVYSLPAHNGIEVSSVFMFLFNFSNKYIPPSLENRLEPIYKLILLYKFLPSLIFTVFFACHNDARAVISGDKKMTALWQ